jgi:AcrR family transcriptional regulator
MGRATKQSCAPKYDLAQRRSAADRLSDVASELFYRRGIRAVGVDEIVNETGVTKPTLYRSYSSKDELVTVCLRKKVDEMSARWVAIAARHPDDPRKQIREIIRMTAADIAAPEFRGCMLTNSAVEFPEFDHPAREVSETCKAQMRGRLLFLARAIPAEDPETLADGLMLLIEGALTIRHTSGSQGPAASLVTASEAFLRAHRVS